MMKIALRLLILPLCVCAAVESASAQKFAFHGIPWGTPAESLRPAVEARGFAFERTEGDGDQLFTRGDGAALRATLRDGRLIGITLTDAARGAGAVARYGALADSLRDALGEPDEAPEDERERGWVAGFNSVHVWVYPSGTAAQAHVGWRGPGWYDEMDRRNGEAPPPAGYTVVSATPFMKIAIDTTVRTPRAVQGLRGRFRIQYLQPITPSVDGVAQAPLDAVVYEMDFDCAGRRTRLIARTTYLEGREQGSHRPNGQPWTTPRQPDGHYARGLDAVCRAARPAR